MYRPGYLLGADAFLLPIGVLRGKIKKNGRGMGMKHDEAAWDRLLQIDTCGRDDTGADEYRFPYEPTPYRVLERLAASGLFGRGDRLLDYGCGKGRVGFFLSSRTKAAVTGIEYDGRIYEMALKNQRTAVAKAKADFVLGCAEDYPVPEAVNRCYFFNPFSEEILSKVMARILESYYENPREVFLFFYYPSDEYIAHLMTVNELEFYDEIPCGDLFGSHDPRERILIFQLPRYEMR